jgi:hypothetical protein
MDETWMFGSSLDVDVDVDEGVDVDGPGDGRLEMPNGLEHSCTILMHYGLRIVPCVLCTNLAECARKDL